MEITVDFPGGSRVNASFGSFTVPTDQPKEDGGDNAAPAPFELFLVSLATCAGYYVMQFCRSRDIPTEGIRVVQRSGWNETTHLVEKVSIEIQLPADFPKKYVPAVIRSAGMCTVKRHLERPPAFEITVTH
jgi:putative redox protein